MLTEAQIEKIKEQVKQVEDAGFGFVIIHVVDKKPRWIYAMPSMSLNDPPTQSKTYQQ